MTTWATYAALKNNLRYALLPSALLLLLGACSATGALQGALTGGRTASDTYDLVVHSDSIHTGSPGKTRRLPVQLMVAEPSAVRALSGEHILVKPSPEQITYYPRAVWSDRLTRLVAARLVDRITASNRFRAVSSGKERISADVSLASNIEAFQVEVMDQKATAHIRIFIKLIHVGSGRVFASRLFQARVPASSNRISDGVNALNIAFNEIVNNVSRWVGQRARVS